MTEHEIMLEIMELMRESSKNLQVALGNIQQVQEIVYEKYPETTDKAVVENIDLEDEEEVDALYGEGLD